MRKGACYKIDLAFAKCSGAIPPVLLSIKPGNRRSPAYGGRGDRDDSREGGDMDDSKEGDGTMRTLLSDDKGKGKGDKGTGDKDNGDDDNGDKGKDKGRNRPPAYGGGPKGLDGRGGRFFA